LEISACLPDTGTLIFHGMPARKRKMKKIRSSPDSPPGDLYSRAFAAANSETLEVLYNRTRLPLSWLRKFRTGEIKNPSVNRIETLLKAFGGI
jgi:hypothetical protein